MKSNEDAVVLSQGVAMAPKGESYVIFFMSKVNVLMIT